MNIEKNKINMIASALVKVLAVECENKLSKNNADSPAVTNIKIGISFITTSLLILKGIIKTAKPNIKKMFDILLPITFPNSISVLPVKWALKEMASSGAEVPKATIVKPITVVGILKFRAKEAAPSTKKSAHLINMAKPTIDRIIINVKSK
jgi:hypothetical protein